MSENLIKSIDQLRAMLDTAMQLEHATIPPYLTALYSIYPETNIEARQVLRAVLVEEMLHLTLTANLLNAIGFRPNLLADDFVPVYPTRLPSGETDFSVHIDKFSKESLETFLKIERPAKHTLQKNKTIVRSETFLKNSLFTTPVIKKGDTYHFYSIGEFYQAIMQGFIFLEQQANAAGSTIFKPDASLQVDPEYYYSGGGRIIPVSDLESAIEAMQLIQGQGEGYENEIFDEQGEIAHFYRFEQLKLGRFYHVGDEPGHPSGEKFEVDWDAVYPMIKDPKLESYPADSEIQQAATGFNQEYQRILSKINRAYCGEKEILNNAVCGMFRLKEYATQLIRNPIPGQKKGNAGPTFEIPTVTVAERQSSADVEVLI